MNRNELYEVFTEMKSLLGTDELLEELFEAMSVQEALDNLEHIDRNWDCGLFEEDEDDEEEEG